MNTFFQKILLTLALVSSLTFHTAEAAKTATLVNHASKLSLLTFAPKVIPSVKSLLNYVPQIPSSLLDNRFVDLAEVGGIRLGTSVHDLVGAGTLTQVADIFSSYLFDIGAAAQCVTPASLLNLSGAFARADYTVLGTFIAEAGVIYMVLVSPAGITIPVSVSTTKQCFGGIRMLVTAYRNRGVVSSGIEKAKQASSWCYNTGMATGTALKRMLDTAHEMCGELGPGTQYGTN